MVSWSFKKVLDRRLLLYRLGSYVFTGIFILFFLFLTQLDISYHRTLTKTNYYDENYSLPSPAIIEVNYRSNPLTFLEVKNKRPFTTVLSPFDLTHHALASRQVHPLNSLEQQKNLQPIGCQLNFLLLDMPPPSIQV